MEKCTLVPLHVGLSVSDVDASIQWYRDNLGFELIGRSGWSTWGRRSPR